MATGKVSHFDAVRGYGFIIRDDGGNDVFVHKNFLVNADILKKGQRISFEVVTDEKRRDKPRADNVKVLDGDQSEVIARVFKNTPKD